MISSVLFYDVETNGVDPDKDDVVEVAGIHWSVNHASTLSGFSFVMHAEDNAAEAINGIPAGLLRDAGIQQAEGWKRVAAWFGRADVIVAHNAGFDRSFTDRHVPVQAQKPWVCTQDDVDFPRAAPGSKLTDLLLAHGLGVSHAHRALVDVMNLARLFERSKELGSDPAAMLAKAMRPKTTYKAQVSFHTNQLAKDAGFRWDPERKMWWRKICPEDLPGMKLRFQVTEVSGG